MEDTVQKIKKQIKATRSQKKYQEKQLEKRMIQLYKNLTNTDEW